MPANDRGEAGQRRRENLAPLRAYLWRTRGAAEARGTRPVLLVARDFSNRGMQRPTTGLVAACAARRGCRTNHSINRALPPLLQIALVDLSACRLDASTLQVAKDLLQGDRLLPLRDEVAIQRQIRCLGLLGKELPPLLDKRSLHERDVDRHGALAGDRSLSSASTSRSQTQRNRSSSWRDEPGGGVYDPHSSAHPIAQR